MLLKRIKVLSLLVFFVLSSACVSEGSFLGFGTPEISAPELLKQYTTDEAKADKKYTGKEIIVTGTIKMFGKASTGWEIFLESASYSDVLSAITSNIRSVICKFPESASNKLAQLRSGQAIRVTGTCKGLMINVNIENCTLNSPKVSEYFDSSLDTGQAVSGVKLLRDYASNVIAATLRYKGKRFRVSGKIFGFDSNNRGTYIELDPEYEQLPFEILNELREAISARIKCYLSDEVSRQIMFIDKGQQVVISGLCEGTVFSDCTIVEPFIDIPEKILLSSEQLVRDFNSDTKTANLKYKGDRFIVSGVIKSFAEVNDGLRVSIGTVNSYESVECYFPQSEAWKIAQLRKSQQVIINGKCNGLSGSDVLFDSCVLDEPSVGESDIETELSAEEVLNKAGANEIAINIQYKGKMLKISGVIGSLAEDSDGIYIELKASGLAGEIKCYMKKEALEQILSLNEGQQIIVSGNCFGQNGNSVKLNDCSVIEPAISSYSTAGTVFSPEEIVSEFASNSLKSKIRYQDKQLTIKGEIKSFMKTNSVYGVSLISSGQTDEVKCYFARSELLKIAQLLRMQTITVKGSCSGLKDGHIVFENCTLEDPSLDWNNLAPSDKLSAVELLNENKLNNIAVEIKYLGKAVKIAGEIQDFCEDSKGVYIALGHDKATEQVRCYMRKKNLEQIISLHRKQEITISGRCTGNSEFSINIEDCSVIEPIVTVSSDVFKNMIFSPEQILNDYDFSAVVAKVKYHGKRLNLVGMIDDIICEGDKYYLTLNSEDPSRKIKCYLQDEAVRKIILYSEGENISLSGVCEGYISGVVKFEKCLIVSQNSVSGGASINTMDDRQLERMNYLQSTHADFCRQMFQRHRMTRYRSDVAECLSTLNRFLTIWPKNLRNDDGNEVKQASDFLKAIQHVVYGTLEIVEGDFSKEDGWTDTPDMKISFMVNGKSYATSIVQNQKYPKFNESFSLMWSVDIGTITFTGIEVDAVFDDVVFNSSVDASGFKGYERLSGTLYNNGNSLTIKFSPSQSIPVCPW